MCKYENCDKIPVFNKPGESKALYCYSHKESGMINVKHKKCKLCHYIRANPKYSGYCMMCYVYTFPNTKISRNYKTKEKLVGEYIKNNFNEYDFVFDHRIEYGCSRRRPDIFLEYKNYVIIIEVDENQHIDYDIVCERNRLNELYIDIGYRPMYLIRFNPDSYTNKDGVKISSCFYNGKITKNKETEWNSRLEVLKETLNECITREPCDVEIISLFYNE